jgi:hypothetical protein
MLDNIIRDNLHSVLESIPMIKARFSKAGVMDELEKRIRGCQGSKFFPTAGRMP